MDVGRALNWLFIILIRFLFVATSLMPVFFLFGVSNLERNCRIENTPDHYIVYFLISFFLFLLCGIILYLAGRKDTTPMPIDEIDWKDSDLLAFLFIFLLPIISNDKSPFETQLWTTIICFTIIILAMADFGTFYFNPTLRLFRYRIYSFKVDEKDCILIAKSNYILRSIPGAKLPMTNIGSSIYIHNSKKMRKEV